MGFLKPVAKVATFGLVGSSLLGNKKKSTDKPTPPPTGYSEGSLINTYQGPKKQLY